MSTNAFDLALRMAQARNEEDPENPIGPDKQSLDQLGAFDQALRMAQGGEDEVEKFKSKLGIDTGRSVTQEPDVGIVGAFAHGAKEGFLEPLTILGREASEITLDETSEKIASGLGTFVGLGIGFIPFAAGTGAVLRGVGLAAKLKAAQSIKVGTGEAVRTPLYNFVRNTIAGSAQFGGTSEEVEDLPANLAAGAAFGAVVEGFFLTRAIRGRANAAKGAIDDLADATPSPETLGKEMSLAPIDGQEQERIAAALRSLAKEDVSFDKVLIDLTDEHVPTINLLGLGRDTDEIVRYAKERLPNAQVLTRSTQGKKASEVLIHNPINPEDALSPKQVAQWKSTGFAENQVVIYKGNMHVVTGATTAKGRVQIFNPERPGTKFAPDVNDITRPVETRFINGRERQGEVLTQVLEESQTNVGFVAPAARNQGMTLSAKRGSVDTTEYARETTLKKFMTDNAEEIAKIEAPSPREALEEYAKRIGVRGLIETDTGTIHVFDQSTINFIREIPQQASVQPGLRRMFRPAASDAHRVFATPAQARRFANASGVGTKLTAVDVPESIIIDPTGIERRIEGMSILKLDELDKVRELPFKKNDVSEVIPNVGLTIDNVVSSSTMDGKTLIHSITPSWKNQLEIALRRQGIPQKEFPEYFALHRARQTNELANLMDDEFKALHNASRAQYAEGCI